MPMFVMTLFTAELIELMRWMIAAFGRIVMATRAIPCPLLVTTGSAIAIDKIISDVSNFNSVVVFTAFMTILTIFLLLLYVQNMDACFGWKSVTFPAIFTPGTLFMTGGFTTQTVFIFALFQFDFYIREIPGRIYDFR